MKKSDAEENYKAEKMLSKNFYSRKNSLKKIGKTPQFFSKNWTSQSNKGRTLCDIFISQTATTTTRSLSTMTEYFLCVWAFKFVWSFGRQFFLVGLPQEQSLLAATGNTGPIERNYPLKGSKNVSANVERSCG